MPFHGEDAHLQKRCISKRSRRRKGVLASLAQDAETRAFCYRNAAVRKEDQSDEILRFVEHWERRTGHLPDEPPRAEQALRLTSMREVIYLNRSLPHCPSGIAGYGVVNLRWLPPRQPDQNCVDVYSEFDHPHWTYRQAQKGEICRKRIL